MSADPRGEPRPQALLFDLGGVVIDLDFGRVFERWADLSGEPVAAVRGRFRFDAAYERHERGEIDGAEYFRILARTLEVDLTPAELEDGWNRVYVGPFPGVTDLLADLASRLPLYAFTNSNPSHEATWSTRYQAELASFRSIFVSSTIGRRKPDVESFQLVADLIGRPVDEIHFFDDSPQNVEGAGDAGMPATLVRSFDGLVEATRRLVPRVGS